MKPGSHPHHPGAGAPRRSPPGHNPHGSPPTVHSGHHPHHGPPPPPHLAGPPPAPGFSNMPAFNSGLAAAIAAAEFQKQREAAVQQHIFAAAQANGVPQPFLPSGHPFPPQGAPPPHPPGYAGPGGVGPPHPPGFDYSNPVHTPHQPQTLHIPRAPPELENQSPPHRDDMLSPDEDSLDSTNPTSAAAGPLQPRLPIFSNGRPELPPPRWYDASVPLGVSEDRFYLSEMQCVLRSEFVEAFGTAHNDSVQPVQGRTKPIALGQVGIRCQHCKDISSSMQFSNLLKDSNPGIQHAVAYPSLISGIYNTVQQMYRLHFDQCPYIPDELKVRVGNLKDSHTSNRGGRKQYWMESAKRIGLVDTTFGVHYGRDPEEPLPPLGGVGRRDSFASHSVGGDDDDYIDDYNGWTRQTSQGSAAPGSFDGGMGGVAEPYVGGHQVLPAEDCEVYPLVQPEDSPLISDYLYLALEQMQPCNLMDADRVGCYKGRRTGFPGLACKHCIGQAGCGRYFPASEASLSQTTTSQTIVNHVRNCRRCPLEIREELELMKRAKTCPEYKKTDKPKHGGRKVFFHRLWCRIQRIPLPKNDKAHAAALRAIFAAKAEETPEMEPLSPSTIRDEASPILGSPDRKRKHYDDLSEIDGHKKLFFEGHLGENTNLAGIESDSDSDVDGREVVKFDSVHPTNAENISSFPVNETAASAATIGESNIVYHGRARLSRGDDLHWLSEADCFIRQELTEVFTAKKSDKELFGQPEIGQVGLRCFYCAEQKRPEDRNRGHCSFPLSLTGLQQAASDLQRRHFGTCTEIPEDIRQAFRNMKGYGSISKGDIAGYWVDSARELGLHDIAPEGQGIAFFRNPLGKSPADLIDAEKANGELGQTGSVLVLPKDRVKGTDHALHLLKQFEPCQFRAADRKSSRSRDRALGSPGLVCVHCKMKRYFPITDKKLQECLPLMIKHLSNCFHAPMNVNASLAYLHHRSLLQRAELPSQWKGRFLRSVWRRLHEHLGLSVVDASTTNASITAVEPTGNKGRPKLLQTTTSTSAKDDDKLQEESDAENDDTSDNFEVTGHHGQTQDHYYDAGQFGHDNTLHEMKDLIKAAALWLTERDAEDEARGRVRGMKRR